MENLKEGDKVASDNQPTVEEKGVIALNSMQPASRPDFNDDSYIFPLPKSWEEYVQRKSTAPVAKGSLMYNLEFKRVVTNRLKECHGSLWPSAFLACEKCYRVFPAFKDNDLRKHMLIEHGDEFEADEIVFFELCKPATLCFRRCKKCGLDVLEDGEMHLFFCDPEADYDEAFDCYQCYPYEGPYEAKCGLCYYKYVSRYELRAHIKFAHPQLFGKIILFPEYRCVRCLKRFEDSWEAMNHVALCKANEMEFNTLFELAVGYLFYCSVCSKFHGTVEEKQACHTMKALRECFICDTLFKNEDYLLDHMKQYHSLIKCATTGEVYIACPYCAESGDLVSIENHVVVEHYEPLIPTILERCSVEVVQQDEQEISENMPSTSQASTTEISSTNPVVATTAEKQPACSTETPEEPANLSIPHPRDLPRTPNEHNEENEQERENVATENEPTIEKEVASLSLKQASLPATAVETGPEPSSLNALPRSDTSAEVAAAQPPACSTETPKESPNLSIPHPRDLPQAPKEHNEENEQEKEKVATENEPKLNPARDADAEPEPKPKKIKWTGKLFSGFFKP